jgi:hypothetical protein
MFGHAYATMHEADERENVAEYSAPSVDCGALPQSVVVGENGHAALSAEGLGDPLLALFDKLVRDVDVSKSSERVRALVEDVLADARARGDTESVKNLFVMAFQTRWCRGGKAERMLFYVLVKILYARFPAVVLGLVRLIPEYGYWKDLLSLLGECPIDTGAGAGAGAGARADAGVDYGPLHAEVWALFAQQLKTDAAELASAEAEQRGRAQQEPAGGPQNLRAALSGLESPSWCLLATRRRQVPPAALAASEEPGADRDAHVRPAVGRDRVPERAVAVHGPPEARVPQRGREG